MALAINPVLRLCALILATYLWAGPPAQAEDIKYGRFEEFTLYNADHRPLQDKVIFMFHGFGSAMPNGAYERVHRAFAKEFSVVGFNYDYFDLAANDTIMDLVWEWVLKGRNITFAGTSLGGFWANYYGEKYGVERVMIINPVVAPVEQLSQFIGKHYIKKRGYELEVTQADIDRHTDRAAPPVPGIERLVILSRDDAVLDYRLAEAAYTLEGTELVLFDDGGHTVDIAQERYLELLRGFLFDGE